MAKIQIRVESGMIQEIEGIPVETTIEVFDYDVGKYTETQLARDESGRLCDIREWRASE
jgi:hypothetical protein